MQATNQVKKTRGGGRKGERVRRVYIFCFFNCHHLLVSSLPAENQISRRSSWPCWSSLTGTTRRERPVERCREGLRLGDRYVHCSVSNVFLVAGVAGLAVREAAMLPTQVGDGGGGDPRPYAFHHSKPEHSPNPRNRRRTWSLREAQSTHPPRPRLQHVRKTC